MNPATAKRNSTMALRNAYKAAHSNPNSWVTMGERENFEDGYDRVGAVLFDMKTLTEKARGKMVATLLPLCSPYVAERLSHG